MNTEFWILNTVTGLLVGIGAVRLAMTSEGSQLLRVMFSVIFVMSLITLVVLVPLFSGAS